MTSPEPTTLQAGIYTLAADAYHADPCDTPSLSASIARILCVDTPIHAWTQHPRLNPDYQPEEAEKFDIGTAAHALLLQGDEIAEVLEFTDWRTNAAKDARDEARANGRLPLLAKNWQQVRRMVEAARIQLQGVDANPVPFTGGQPEQTLVWTDQGAHCRARLDWLRDDRAAIDDYKTTSRPGGANPEAWSRSLFNMGYDVQAAFYLRGVHQLTGAEPDWRWVVQETAPPYALSVVSLTPAARELADAKVEYALKTWRDCLAANVWPGYPTQVCYAELPGWEEARWLEKEERES